MEKVIQQEFDGVESVKSMSGIPGRELANEETSAMTKESVHQVRLKRSVFFTLSHFHRQFPLTALFI